MTPARVHHCPYQPIPPIQRCVCISLRIDWSNKKNDVGVGGASCNGQDYLP